MAEKREYYEVLGVDPGATPDEIKRAYRRLAREVHPDVSEEPGAEERFKELGEAYAVLSDPEKRARYDQYGHEAPGGFDWGAGGFPDIFELFNIAFGGAWSSGGRSARAAGADLRADVSLSLEEVLTGTEREVPVSRLVTCESCAGGGAAAGTVAEACPTCGGAGRVRDVRSGFGIQFSSVRACPHCGGSGSYVPHPCEACEGQGLRRQTRKVGVQIPPGVETGQRIRVPGEGDAGVHGAPTGDLYVFLQVEGHEFFQREGRDLFCEVKLSFAQAALGDIIEVPTLNGPAEIGVPAGTQTGEVFVLRGQGLPEVHTERRGHQRVRVRVKTPTRLTARQKELLLELSQESGETVQPHEGGFFERLKRALRED